MTDESSFSESSGKYSQYNASYSSSFMNSNELYESYVVGDTITLCGDLLASLVKIDAVLFLFIQEKRYYTINQELKVLSVEPYTFRNRQSACSTITPNLYQLLIMSWK
ncbi:Hypothetical_protein [Hexamita inflata]|uniref:Hypothetical_protein n=1 Tax=Hexamita inflata TaxID=28002 RepID=A0AA86NHI4_9EUKA|nr:Hypothetical protein HINF_LOCUS6784 [Hexamita inflata]